MNKEKHIELINDHYKDTFLYQREYLKQRDRLFIYVILVLVALFVFMYVPTQSMEILEVFVNNQLGSSSLKFNANGINSILWFVLLVFTMKYFQLNIVVERQYKYLNILEKEINEYIGKQYVFQREGKSYATLYKCFPNIVWIIYTYTFPILLLGMSIVKLIQELKSYSSFELTLILDIILFLILCIVVISYFYSYHFEGKIGQKKQKLSEKQKASISN